VGGEKVFLRTMGEEFFTAEALRRGGGKETEFTEIGK
jgi:hypothetical protein